VVEEARSGLAIPRALEIARGIASGLGAAHAQGTVHRDIKPENILLARDAEGRERPKILDFGIVAMAESVTRLSMTRGLLLTPDYAAPEQWEEMPADEMDGRTDIYALGSVFYEMLTGHTPFQSHNTAGWMRQHLGEAAKPPSQMRPELADWQGLDALVLRMLAKDRNLRQKDAAEVLSQLDAVQFGAAKEQRRTVQEDVWKREERAREDDKARPEPIPQPTPDRITVQPPLPLVPDEESESRKFPAWAWGAVGTLALVATFAAGRLFVPQAQPAPTSAPVLQPQTAGDLPKPTVAMPEQVAPSKPSSIKPVAPQEQKPTPVENSRPSEQKPSINDILVQASALKSQHRSAEAAPLYAKACDSGSSLACANLAVLYSDGDGVAKDIPRAVSLFSRSCEGGLSYSCDYLGRIYTNGVSVAKDDALANYYSSKAVALYSKGCVNNRDEDCAGLGDAYRLGAGVGKDTARARQFLTKGCNLGSRLGCEHLKEME